MDEIDPDIEVLRDLLEAGGFRGRNETLAKRGSATVALVHLVGIPCKMLPGLLRGHWLRNGEAIELDADKFCQRRGITRIIPVVDAARMVVERYLMATPGGEKEPLLQAEDGGPITHRSLVLAFNFAAKDCGRPSLSLGRARTLFESLLVAAANDRDDGMVEYITGRGRYRHRHLLDSPPSEQSMRKLLNKALSSDRCLRFLTHQLKKDRVPWTPRRRQKVAQKIADAH
jgi:hypothetical protein